MTEWWACRVSTGKEYEIRKKILSVVPDAQIEVPRRYYKENILGVIKTKSERILPGYILIGTQSSLNPLILKDSIKVIGRVTEEEYAVMKAQEGNKEAILSTGARILVINGPLQGCKGNVSKLNDNNTYHCRLVFQGMELEVDIREDLISTIS